MAGSTIRAYIVMVYASLSVRTLSSGSVDTRHFCIRTNALNNYRHETRKRNAGYELATVL